MNDNKMKLPVQRFGEAWWCNASVALMAAGVFDTAMAIIFFGFDKTAAAMLGTIAFFVFLAADTAALLALVSNRYSEKAITMATLSSSIVVVWATVLN